MFKVSVIITRNRNGKIKKRTHSRKYESLKAVIQNWWKIYSWGIGYIVDNEPETNFEIHFLSFIPRLGFCTMFIMGRKEYENNSISNLTLEEALTLRDSSPYNVVAV